jgi:hypothetical protein
MKQVSNCHQDGAESHNSSHQIIHLRRRSAREWLSGFSWLILLIVLLEYTLRSLDEHEPQAAVLAGALFLGLLIAGIVFQIVCSIESRNPYQNNAHLPSAIERSDEND